MTITAVVGKSQAFSGLEAASQATKQALDLVGRSPIVLGIIVASYRYAVQDIIAGITPLIGDAPLFGFSTSSEITQSGVSQHSIIVALITGDNIIARANWLPGYDNNSASVTQMLMKTLQPARAKGCLLIAADGINGNGTQIGSALPDGNYDVAGCLAGGSLLQDQTYQIGGKLSGTNGIAAAFISGNLATGIGVAHGCQPLGISLKVTSSIENRILTLNGEPACDIYSKLFHFPAQDWLLPPLNQAVHLYPFGFVKNQQGTQTIRAPIRMESDGSLRMNSPVPEGSTLHLLAANTTNCIEAAKKAASQALKELGKARPVIGMLITDVSWQMLFQATPGREIQAIRAVLGEELLMIGGYTFGQLTRLPAANKPITPELLNEHFGIIILGEKM